LSRPDFFLGEVRRLTALYMAGGSAAFDAFLDLVSLLLNLTILAPGGAVHARLPHTGSRCVQYVV